MRILQMKNSTQYSVCDDKLVSMISAELAHYGLFVPISEIEYNVIKGYDDIQRASQNDPDCKTLDCYIKDDRYYAVLSNLACADIMARARLMKVRDAYEAASTLTILQKYLDNVSKAAGTIKTYAPQVFKEIIETWNFPIQFVINNDSWSAAIPKPGESAPQVEDYKKAPDWSNAIKPYPIAIAPPKGGKVTQVRVCTNNPQSWDTCSKCPCCDDGEDSLATCCDQVTLSVAYRGVCYGFAVDPGLFGLNGYCLKDDLPDKANVVKNMIQLGARELKKMAQEIFIGLYTAHHDKEDE